MDTFELMMREMELLKGPVMNNIRILARHDRDDNYYRELAQLAKAEYFFETYQVILWAGLRLRPRRVLEIGTRNGGSLVQLLSAFHTYEGMRVVTFDLFRELTGLSKHLRLGRIVGPMRVRRNLRRLNIPTDFIEFVVGDSRETVPAWKRKHLGEQFDYVLVDGGHERAVARADLANVADLIAADGILIFDDIGPESYQLIDVWEEFRAAHEGQFQWYEKRWRKGVAWAIRQ